jgi:hypothetical protein
MSIEGCGPTKPFSQEELEQLLSPGNFGLRNKLLFAFCCSLACRPSELRSIVLDVDQQNSAVLKPLDSSEDSHQS